MSEVRDLYVGIRFEDDVSKNLKRVDKQVDDVRDGLESLGAEANDVEMSLNSMSTGFNGLDDVKTDARQAKKALNDLDGKDVNVDVNSNIGKLKRELFSLQGLLNLSKFNSEGMTAAGVFKNLAMLGGKFSSILGLIVAGLSAVIAAGAPLLLVVGGLAASLGAAAGGAAAFGAVAIPTLTKVFDAADQVQKIQDKINKATTVKERIKAEKELAALYDGMSKSQRGALNNLQNFKVFWGDFTKKFEDPVFDIFRQGLTVLQGVLIGLEPTITNVSAVIENLIGNLNKQVSGGGLQGFFDWLANNGAEALNSFAIIVGNTLSGVFSWIQAFTPIGASMEEGLISLTERFKEWSAGIGESQGFQNFVEYAKTNGPIVLGVISELWNIFKNIVIDLAPLGTTVLGGLQAFFGFINENWSTVSNIAVGIGAFAIALGTLTGVITVITIAQWAWNAALLANPVTWVIVGIAALIAIGVLLYKNWDTISAKASELWSTITAKWGAIKQSTSETWGNVKTAIGNAMDTARAKVSSFFAPLLGFISSAKGAWNGFVGAIRNFKMPSFKLPSFGGGGKADGSHATGLARVPFDNYKANVHKDEAILTAKQSNALRNAGILKENADGTPALNVGGGSGATNVSGAKQAPVIHYSPVVQIDARGSSADTSSIKKIVKEQLDEQSRKLLTLFDPEEVY